MSNKKSSKTISDNLLIEKIEKAINKQTYLSPTQIQQFLEAVDKIEEEYRQKRRNSRKSGKSHLPDIDKLYFVDHKKPWFMIAFLIGFMPGDIFGLKWEDVSFKHKKITKVIEKTAHIHPAPMTFSIPDRLIKILEQWKIQCGNPEKGLVFTNPKTGKRFCHKTIQKHWKKILKCAGLPSAFPCWTHLRN